MRDPSAILVAFVLPVVMIFVFAFALSLDQRRVPIGVVLEGDGAEAHSLAAAFAATDYFVVTPARDRREVAPGVVSGRLRGFVVIPQDFETRLKEGSRAALVQIITDGSQPNTATFVAAYARGVVGSWLSSRDDACERGAPARARRALLVQPGDQQPPIPDPRRDRDHHDVDRHAADGAGRRA